MCTAPVMPRRPAIPRFYSRSIPSARYLAGNPAICAGLGAGGERLLRRLHVVGIDEAAGLAPPQGGVVAAVPQQLVVAALLDDAPALEHDQPVHARNGREPVRD